MIGLTFWGVKTVLSSRLCLLQRKVPRLRGLQAALVAADAVSFIIPDNLMERMIGRLIEIFQFDRLTVGEKLKNIAFKLSEFDIKPSMVFQILYHYSRSAEANQRYAAAYEKSLRRVLEQSKDRGEREVAGFRIEDLWDGMGDSGAPDGNPNAWVNILRHKKSSTINYGGEGGAPQSIWVLSYSNFERLYYNLVVNYREFDNLPHKLATWRHVSYVRLEAEDLAISFLPPEVREQVRQSFTQGLGEIKQDMFFDHHSMTGTPRPTATQIAAEGRPQFMPETIYVNIPDSQQQHFTLVNDRGYQAHNIVFIESRNRDPKGDSLSLFRGFLGAYPDVFLKFNQSELEDFVAKVKAMRSEADWTRVAQQFGVRRNSADFWPHFDAIHTWKSSPQPGNDPREQGIADLRLYDFF